VLHFIVEMDLCGAYTRARCDTPPSLRPHLPPALDLLMCVRPRRVAVCTTALSDSYGWKAMSVALVCGNG
jgi:hypothetical protein